MSVTKPQPRITRSQMETSIVSAVITSALAAGYSVSVDNGGDEDELARSTDLTAILGALFATDDEYLYFYPADAAPDANHWSWVRFIYGNSGWDVVADYGMNLDPLMASAEALSNQYSDLEEA